MAIYKKVNLGDYNLAVPNGDFVITTDVIINGNLTITGGNVSSNIFYDPTITLNANLTANDSPYTGQSGLVVNRGSEANAVLLYSETGSYAGKWSVSNGSATGYVLTSYDPFRMDYTTSNPAGDTNVVVVTANTPDLGGSGLYVNAASQTAELVTSVKAKKYAIIFG